MSEPFNPYHQWLGLPHHTSAPSHYELLGLPIRESDHKKIELAAEQAATKVRSFRPGAHASDWARLLDEIHAARVTLLDPARKTRYDQQLTGGNGRAAAAQGDRRVEASTQSGVRAFDDLYPPGFRPAGSAASAEAGKELMPAHSPIAEASSPAPSAPQLPPMTAAPAATSTAVVAAPQDAYVPSGIPLACTPGYGLPTAPSAFVPHATPLSVPAPLASAAQPYVPSGLVPQPYPVATAVPYSTPASIDPMAPVAIPGMTAAPAAVAPTMPMSAMPVTTFPVASLPLAMPVGAVANGQPAMSVPTPVTQVADSGPQVRKASAASVMLAARKEKQTRNAALLAGAAAGLVVVAGLVAYAVVSSRLNQTDEQQVAQSNAKNRTPTTDSSAKSNTSDTKTKGASGNSSEADSTRVTNNVQPVPEPNVNPTPAPPPTPMPMTAPEPKAEPQPAPVPPPMPAKPTRQQVTELAAALKQARLALSEQSFDEAEAEVVKAEKAAVLDEHRALVERLRLAIDHVKLFRQALVEATSKLDAAETIKVGSSTVVAIVETFPDKITVRVSGMNRTYSFDNIPPGLAVAIVDAKRIGGQPDTRVLKAVYVATGKNADAEAITEARGWLEQVESSESNAAQLLNFLDDSYDNLLADFDKAEKNDAAAN